MFPQKQTTESEGNRSSDKSLVTNKSGICLSEYMIARNFDREYIRAVYSSAEWIQIICRKKSAYTMYYLLFLASRARAFVEQEIQSASNCTDSPRYSFGSCFEGII